MSTFEQTKGLFNQTHFSIVEIDVPVVEGTCTVDGLPGFGTPLSCDQASDATKTYKFTQIEAPFTIAQNESGILRLIKAISETPAKLNVDKGLASRGSVSISFVDIEGKDPNPDAPAVNATVTNQGSFFSKLVARNELTNKAIRIKNYRVESDGTIDLVNGAQTRHYIIEAVNPKKNDEWQIICKDELSKINIGDSVWPLPLEGSLRSAVDDIVLDFPVDANVTYLVGDTVRIGDELIKISSVSGIGTGAAVISTLLRGASINYTNFLSATVKASHDQNDEVYVCEVSDNERIDLLLQRILIDIGIDPSFIPIAEWQAEIDEWHPSTRINTLWLESISTSDVLEKILSNFMIDMWFDPVAREIKISAISVWKESTSMLMEDDQINFESINRKREENLRSTRALIIYDKRSLATSDSVENFKKASLFKRTELEVADLFGEPKTKRFDFSAIIDKNAADLLVNRWVNRYVNPFSYSWTTPERKLTFNTGDVVDINTRSEVSFDGSRSRTSRAQITSIKPNYRREGRDYTVTALSYEPLFSTGSEIIISGNVTDVNLFIQYAGAPSQAVELTFVFDGTVGGGSSNNIPAIKAGAFPAGSKLIIILVNGADLMAKGGDGGRGESIFFDQETSQWLTTIPQSNGVEGGIVIDANGVDMDIYFSGATPSTAYPIADGFIRAPSGGGGGHAADENIPIGGASGDGGDGRVIGLSGEPGCIQQLLCGANGTNGSDDGFTGFFGQPGANNDALGGAAGSGIIDNGATVVLFGSNATRYKNGNGDH